MRSFVKINSSRKAEITLPFTDIGKSCLVMIFSVANMYLNAFRESKILAKISEFTVFSLIAPFIDILMFNVKYLAMEKRKCMLVQ